MKKTLNIMLASLPLIWLQPLLAGNFIPYFQAAQHNDNTLLNQFYQYQSAQDNIGVARSSFLPSLVLDANYNFHSNSKGYTSYDLSLTQSLFNFSNWATLYNAKYTARSQFFATIAAWQDLCERYISAYLKQSQAQQTLALDKKSRLIDRKLYRLTKKMYTAGQIKSTDVNTAYSTLLAQNTVIIKDQQSLSALRSQLSIITHSSIRRTDQLKTPLPLIKPVPATLQRWKDQAIIHNPGLLSKHYDTLAAKESISVAWAGHLPTLSLTTSYNHNAEGANLNNSSGSAGLSLPIFSGFKTMAASQKARDDYAAQAQLELLTKQQLLAATETAFNTIVFDIQSIRSTRRAIIAAQKTYHDNLITYKHGFLDITPLLQSKQSLYQQQQQILTAKYDYVTQIVKLRQSIGALGKPDIINLASWLH